MIMITITTILFTFLNWFFFIKQFSFILYFRKQAFYIDVLFLKIIYATGGGGGACFGGPLYNHDSGGASCAKRASGAPWVSKSTHPRKFGYHVTVHRPSVRTIGKPMFTLSSSFGSIGKMILHTNCTLMLWSIDSCQNKASADQYYLTVSRAQVSAHRGRVFSEVIRWQVTSFLMIAGSSFFLTRIKYVVFKWHTD